MTHLEIVALDAVAGSAFEAMPGVSPEVNTALTEGRACAWGALTSGAPAGLACATWAQEGAVAQLVTCYVRPLQRRQGIATALLARLEEYLVDRGHRRIWCRYPDESPLTAPVEALLRRRAWDEPAHLATHVRVRVEDLLRLPWRRFRDLPADLACATWNTVTASEIAELHDAERTASWFPVELAPWRSGISTPEFDPEQSLVLRDEDGIRGWLLVLRSAPATAHITSAWVDPGLQRIPPVPPFVPMCVRAIETGAQRGYQDVTWSIHRNQPRMATFNRRHLRPVAAEITHERVSGHDLAAGAAVPPGADPGGRPREANRPAGR